VITATMGDVVDAGVGARRIHEKCRDGHDRDENQCEHALMVASAIHQHQSGYSGYRSADLIER